MTTNPKAGPWVPWPRSANTGHLVPPPEFRIQPLPNKMRVETQFSWIDGALQIWSRAAPPYEKQHGDWVMPEREYSPEDLEMFADDDQEDITQKVET